MSWKQQIEAQIEAQRELAKEHQMLRGFSVILDSEDRAVLRNTADTMQALLDENERLRAALEEIEKRACPASCDNIAREALKDD